MKWQHFKFRGIREDTGAWCYGLLSYRTTTTRGIPEETPLISGYLGDQPVKPETVGLCSQLTDIRGDMIFDGDILESQVGDKHRWVVSFEDGGFLITKAGSKSKSPKKRKDLDDVDYLCEDNIGFYALLRVGTIHDTEDKSCHETVHGD